MRAYVVVLLASLLSGASTEVAPVTTGDPVDRYLNRTDTPLRSFEAFRHLEASTRGGSMRGWLDACTALDQDGFRFTIVSEGGSAVIRRRVLMKALEEEQRVHASGDAGGAAIAPSNYVFEGPVVEEDGLFRVAIRPKRREQMLIDGDIFISPDSGAVARVQGSLAKRPSFWTRHVDVQRLYEPFGQVWAPVRMTSQAQVLMVGESSFVMTYDYVAINQRAVDPRDDASAACVQRRPRTS